MPVRTAPTLAQALRRAAVRATLAPSVHNTQPWRFVVRPDALEIHADLGRGLSALDPGGRQLIISCGCAVFNARVSLAASGCCVAVERFPDPVQPTLVARLIVRGPGESDGASELVALDPAVELRRTNRREFAAEPVPTELIDLLLAAAAAEAAVLTPVMRTADRLALAVLSQRADRQQNADPAYRAELRAWTTDDPAREDGVPAAAVPHGVRGYDEVPIRDFDTRGAGRLPSRTRSDMAQCLLLLGTAGDNPAAWLRAGEALERVLLEVTRYGFAAGLLTQVIEVPATRASLRQELRLTTHPHLLLRVGRAPVTPMPRRRRLVDVLDDVGQ